MALDNLTYLEEKLTGTLRNSQEPKMFRVNFV